MKLYILTAEPYHDNSTVLGVFSSAEKAAESVGKEFTFHEFYQCLYHKLPHLSDRWNLAEDLLIQEFELDVSERGSL